MWRRNTHYFRSPDVFGLGEFFVSNHELVLNKKKEGLLSVFLLPSFRPSPPIFHSIRKDTQDSYLRIHRIAHYITTYLYKDTFSYTWEEWRLFVFEKSPCHMYQGLRVFRAWTLLTLIIQLVHCWLSNYNTNSRLPVRYKNLSHYTQRYTGNSNLCKDY